MKKSCAMMVMLLPAVIFADVVSADVAAASNELDVARSALREGFWDIARLHASKVYGNEARLITLESWASEGKWDEVKKLLNVWKDVTGAAFDYYRAAASGARGQAAKILAAAGVEPAVAAAKMIEAEELEKAGDRQAAEKLWREVVSSSNVSERAFTVAAVNLKDPVLLRRAFEQARSATLRRKAGLSLGVALTGDAKTEAEGITLIRKLVKDAPDTKGADEAFLVIAEKALEGKRWAEAEKVFHEAIEIWPPLAKDSHVLEGRGWAQLGLGKLEDALSSFAAAAESAVTADGKAMAIIKQGDILTELGRGTEAMAKYREVLKSYPETAVAVKLKRVVEIHELEERGRELFKNYKFDEAREIFEKVSADEPKRKPKMDYFITLCLYGRGLEDEAYKRALELTKASPDNEVRADAMLWVAKFLYNRGDWKESGKCFVSYVDALPSRADAPEALLWAARAAFADRNLQLAIDTVTSLVKKYPSDSETIAQALLVQGEALIALARFDEAVLVLERVGLSGKAGAADRARAQILRADALYAMGADNPARYTAALEAYRAVRFTVTDHSLRLVLSFKIARTLEKLKQMDEAIDCYYSEVIVVYCNGRNRDIRYGDDARAAFSRAAFKVADEYEERGLNARAMRVLELVVESGLPAAEEARRRINRYNKKGFL
jgi:TolA-binding protein